MKNIINKLLTIIMIIMIAALLMIALGAFARKGESPLSKLSDNPEDEVYTSIDRIAGRVNYEVKTGADEEISILVSNDISDDQLRDIFYVVDSMQGEIASITTYTQSSKGYRRVSILFKKSDAMYVYESIKKGIQIPDDRAGAKELEKVCRNFLDNNIKDYMTDYEKELTIHDYIVNNCVYGFSEQGDDTEYNAYGVLVNGRAVCSGYAAATNLLLMCSDIECRVVTGEATDIYSDNPRTESHAWNQVRINDEWYNLDVTWDDPVGEHDNLSHQYYNISDEIMDDTHTWEREDYELCTSMKDNYYYNRGAYISDEDSLVNYLTQNITPNTSQSLECALNNLNVNDDSLQFLFGIDGVNSVSYSISGSDKYKILTVYIN